MTILGRPGFCFPTTTAAYDAGAALSDARLQKDYNENHDPDNGQFSEGPGGGSGGSSEEKVNTMREKSWPNITEKVKEGLAKGKAHPGNNPIPQMHIHELRQQPYSEAGRAGFEQALKHIEQNKSINKEHMKRITAEYTNNVVLAKTKAGMIEEMRKHFVRTTRFNNKIK